MANRVLSQRQLVENTTPKIIDMGLIHMSPMMVTKEPHHVKKTLPSTSSLLQVLISSKESRRSAPTALSGARAAGVGKPLCS